MITAEACNARFHYLLSQGVMELSVAFDLPPQPGYDSDDPQAEGEVGKAGVAIDSLEDMKFLFKDIRLEDVSTSMTTGATGYILLAFYAVLARGLGADLKKITGTIRNDKITGAIYPPAAAMRIMTDTFEWCSHELPRWNTVSAPEDAVREAGSDAVVSHADDAIRQMQIEKLNALRRGRDPAKVDSVLQGLNDTAASEENIMPAVIAAVEHSCTLGEIADTLREIFGEYRAA